MPYNNTLTLYKEKPTKARKDHKCSDCDGEILKGQTYTASTGVRNEKYYTQFRSCPDCHTTREALTELRNDSTKLTPLGELRNELRALADSSERAVIEPIITAYNLAAESNSGLLISITTWNVEVSRTSRHSSPTTKP
jgi:hypothetical protein